MRRRAALRMIAGTWLGAVASTGAAPAPEPLRVLFIGNSFTYFNNLPALVAGLAAAGKQRPLVTEMITAGGATLRSLWDAGVAPARIRRGGIDLVVLQEQSTLGGYAVVDGVPQVGDPATFHEYAQRFDSATREAGARTLLYLTWARRHQPAAQPRLTQAYRTLATRLAVTVAPVGIAWEQAQRADPGLVLHIADDSHPNPAGSYLAACVFYATLYRSSPEGLPARLTGIGVSHDGVVETGAGETELLNLDPALARRLQQVAWRVVQAER